MIVMSYCDPIACRSIADAGLAPIKAPAASGEEIGNRIGLELSPWKPAAGLQR